VKDLGCCAVYWKARCPIEYARIRETHYADTDTGYHALLDWTPCGFSYALGVEYRSLLLIPSNGNELEDRCA